MRRKYLANGKPADKRNHRTVSELAEYVGVSERTIERWAKAGTIPPPAEITDKGWKLYSPAQASEVLEARIRKSRIK